MLCSVIIVARNAMPYIADTIKHLDKFADEIILIDNYSTDATYLAMQAFASHSNNTVLYKLEGTVAELRNRGLELAHSDYVIFLDADDLLFPEVLQCHLRQIYQRKADILISSYIRLNYRYDPPDALFVNIGDNPLNLESGTSRCVTSFFIWRKEIITNVKWTTLLHSDQQFLLDTLIYNYQNNIHVVGTIGLCPAGYYRSGWSPHQISNASMHDHREACKRVSNQYKLHLGNKYAFSYR